MCPRQFWVDDFPKFPFGGIWIRSLEGRCFFSFMHWEDPSSILKEIGNCRFHTGLLHKKDLVGDSLIKSNFEFYLGIWPEWSTTTVPTLITIGWCICMRRIVQETQKDIYKNIWSYESYGNKTLFLQQNIPRHIYPPTLNFWNHYIPWFWEEELPISGCVKETQPDLWIHVDTNSTSCQPKIEWQPSSVDIMDYSEVQEKYQNFLLKSTFKNLGSHWERLISVGRLKSGTPGILEVENYNHQKSIRWCLDVTRKLAYNQPIHDVGSNFR